MPHPRKPYAKPAKNVPALLRHLRSKGLSTRGQLATATQALNFVGYHRLLMYMRPLQDANKQFYPGVCFTDVLALYEFDRKLRLVCMDAIERIEVAFRAAISNTLANDKACGSHFYLDAVHFHSMTGHREFLRNVLGMRDKVLSVDHYYTNYNSPALPPVWIVLEQLSIGQLSKLLSSLHLDHRKAIASCFGYNEEILQSWLKSTTLLRNLCAHHSRVWNNNVGADSPRHAKSIVSEFNQQQRDQGRVFNRLVAIQALMNVIDPTSDWKQKLKVVISSLPLGSMNKAGITPAVLGLVIGWEQRPFWQ
ncbi:Abi family protein [Pseudomonas sp. NY15437]|uniref:Abi family protein n=1 Tax=Pseudomonas sp. NY15437 TaxID=3400360 RepID=UPI003A886E3E